MKTEFAPLNDIELSKILENIIKDLPEQQSGRALLGTLVKILRKEGLKCPRCGSVRFHSKGRWHEVFHRYTCNQCGKTFNDLSGTAFDGIHKVDEMTRYFRTCFFWGTTTREAGKLLNVDHKTIFYWRHKLANALRKFEEDVPNEEVQLYEFTEGKNTKGSRHERGRDYSGQPDVQVIKSCGQTQVANVIAVDSANHVIMKPLMFCSRLGKKKGLGILKKWLCRGKTLLVRAGGTFSVVRGWLRRGVRRVLLEGEGGRNLERARRVVSVVKKWGEHFRGVASKYVENYYATITRLLEQNSLLQIMLAILKNHSVKASFREQLNIKIE